MLRIGAAVGAAAASPVFDGQRARNRSRVKLLLGRSREHHSRRSFTEERIYQAERSGLDREDGVLRRARGHVVAWRVSSAVAHHRAVCAQRLLICLDEIKSDTPVRQHYLSHLSRAAKRSLVGVWC